MGHRTVFASTLVADTDYKRSNKDLGRVLALAYLTVRRDRGGGTEEFGARPGRMWDTLDDRFDDQSPWLGDRTGAKLRGLLASPADLD